MRRSDIISHLVGQLDDHERATNRTIRNEAVWPTRKQPQMVERLLKPYLDDLREAGLPE